LKLSKELTMARGTSFPDAKAGDPEFDIESLRGFGLKRLREFWTAHWGRPPRLRSLELLRFVIAWRLQAAQFGGFDEMTERQLRRKAPVRRPMPDGARITREYRGVLHTVEVRAGTLTYAGRSYRSLSQIASEITGTHWNGPSFFGLDRSAAK
jgi:hypothetical protein